MTWELLLRWGHILSAIVLVGGTVFLRFVVVPAMDSLPGQVKPSFLAACRGPWARLVMLTSGLLLLSGLTNAVRIILRYDLDGGMYHGLVGAKLLLALGLFWISSVLAGRSPMAERFREKMISWLNISLVLSVLLIGLAGYMKLYPRVEKQPTPATSRLGVEELRQAHRLELDSWTRRSKRNWKS